MKKWIPHREGVTEIISNKQQIVFLIDVTKSALVRKQNENIGLFQ